MKLKPRYLAMITPSRWMTRSVEGIEDSWIDEMLRDRRIRVVHDFLDPELCFPGVPIMGGVNFFLWDRDNPGKCSYFLHFDKNSEPYLNFSYLNDMGGDIVIRDSKAQQVIGKIDKLQPEYAKNPEDNFALLVSPKDFFTNKEKLTSSWGNYSPSRDENHCIKYYLNKQNHGRPFAWIKKSDIPKNLATKELHKVLIPAACGSEHQVLGYAFYSEPGSVCSQTYLVIGYDPVAHNLNAGQ